MKPSGRRLLYQENAIGVKKVIERMGMKKCTLSRFPRGEELEKNWANMLVQAMTLGQGSF